MSKLIEIKDLKVTFPTSEGKANAVDGISFGIDEGEVVAIVGESGSGKSVTAFSIMNCISKKNIESGEIIYGNNDMLKMSKKEILKIIGKDISMIFQEPMTALNPVMTIGRQITECFKSDKASRRDLSERALRMLKLVGIPGAERVIKSYPHELSGGMRQRVMIAMALAGNPKLLIADEPTTALDVTIQAQILEMIKELKNKMNMSVLMITHDLGIVAEMAERVIVMYAGRIVETGNVRDIFKDAGHPYTKALLDAMPVMCKSQGRLNTIKGTIPKPTELPKGCNFCARCDYVHKICMEKKPPLKNICNDRWVACWRDSEEYLTEDKHE